MDNDVLEGANCPALSTLLSRGRPARLAALSLEAALMGLFGHPEGTPCGALRRLGENVAMPGKEGNCWVCADPIHLRFHQNRLVLADASTLRVCLDEAESLVADLNRHFADVGHFHATSPERWYLRPTDETSFCSLTTPPLSVVAGRSIERLLLDTLPDRASRKLLNEIQTFLHSHSVNQQREKDGLPSINSMWLWGAGSLPSRSESEFGAAWSNHPLALGLAHAANVPAHPLPDGASVFLSQASSSAHHLIVLEDCLSPVCYEDSEAYRKALDALEKRWFAPLRDALVSDQIKHLRLTTTTVHGSWFWECNRRDHWRFWQRRLSLSEIAGNLVRSMP